VWLAARMAVHGNITAGQLVAVYGYTATLAVPVSSFIESAHGLGRGLVAARRIIIFLALRPDIVDEGTKPLPAGDQEVTDPQCGLTVPPGLLTVVVPADLADALTVMDRLARHTESEAALGPVLLRDLPFAETRRTVLLGDHDGYLFGGRLRDVVDTTGSGRLEEALTAAVADEIVRGLPDGLDSPLQPRGRDLSGGQRQRLLLARCLVADPPILLLVEPTSAVDAYTEALMIERTIALRRGRTTVVATSSPLWMQRADRVVVLVEGRVVATGTHGDLLRYPDRFPWLRLTNEDVEPPDEHEDVEPAAVEPPVVQEVRPR